MKKTVFISLSFLFILSSCLDVSKQSRSERNRRISSIIDQLVEENNIPGINLSIVFKDETQESFSSGFADLGNGIKLNKEHVLFSGSIGKTYAVAILMQMIDEGEISLDDKLIDYFPETDWLKLLPNIEDITIEMLLQHTTGLPRYVMMPEIWDSLEANPDKIWTYKDRLSVIFNADAVHEAGKGWAYSDTNYILLGMLIEKLSGKYYYDELRDRVISPENLNFTFAADKRNILNLPIGYSQLDSMFRMPEITVVKGEYAFNPQMEWTGGGIASTTSDLAKWAKIYYHGELFSDSLLQKMIRPNSNAPMDEDSLAYGMGSFIYNTKQGIAFGHSGFVPGFVSIFAYYTEQEIAVAMQINCDYATQKMSLVNYLDRIIAVIPN